VSRLPKGPFLAGLSVTLALAVASMAVLGYLGSAAAPRASAPSSTDRVDTDALIAAQAPSAPPSVQTPASAVPEHGPLLFDVSSMLQSGGQLPARVGNNQLDKVRVVDQGIQFEVSTASRAMVPLPANVQPSSFVAIMNVDLLSGAGAFTFTFHMDPQGDQQHAVQVYTNGTTEAALFDGAAGTRSLFRPVNQPPSLSGSATLAIAVDGPSMRIYVNSIEVGTAHDATLSQGLMGFKAGAAARDDPFVMRLTGLKIFQPANAA